MPKKITLEELARLKEIRNLFIAQQNGELIIFCGAGISYERAKVPLFKNLLENLLNNQDIINIADKETYIAEDNTLKSQYINEISSIFESLCKEYNRILIDEFIIKEIQKGTITSYHESIIRLSKYNNQYKIITTNFDTLFQKAAKKLGIPYNSTTKTQSKIKSYNIDSMPFFNKFKKNGGLIYLHNTIYDEEIIYTEKDFIHTYIAQSRNRELLLNVFNHYTVLFLGYSLSDLLVKYILATSEEKTHYLITRNDGNEASEGIPTNIELLNSYKEYSNIYNLIHIWDKVYSADDKLKQLITIEILNSNDTELDFIYEFVITYESSINIKKISIHSLLIWLQHYHEEVNVKHIHSKIGYLHYIQYILYKKITTDPLINQQYIINFCIEHNIKFNHCLHDILTIIPKLKINDTEKLKFFQYLIKNEIKLQRNADSYDIINLNQTPFKDICTPIFASINNKELLIKYLSFNQLDFNQFSIDKNTSYIVYNNIFIESFYEVLQGNVSLFTNHIAEINNYLISFFRLNKENHSFYLLDLNIHLEPYDIGNRLLKCWFLIMKELFKAKSTNIDIYIKQYEALAKDHALYSKLILYLGKELKDSIPFELINKYAIQPFYNKDAYTKYSNSSINAYLTANVTMIPQEFKDSVYKDIEKLIKELRTKDSKAKLPKSKGYFFGKTKPEIRKNLLIHLTFMQKEFNNIFSGNKQVEDYNALQTITTYSNEIDPDKIPHLSINEIDIAIEKLKEFNINDFIQYDNDEYKAILYYIENNFTEHLNKIYKDFNNFIHNDKKVKIFFDSIIRIQQQKLEVEDEDLPNVIFKLIDYYSNNPQHFQTYLYGILEAYKRKIFSNDKIIVDSITYLFKLLNMHTVPTNTDNKNVNSFVLTKESDLINNLCKLLHIALFHTQPAIQKEVEQLIQKNMPLFEERFFPHTDSELAENYRLAGANNSNFFYILNQYTPNNYMLIKLLTYMNPHDYGIHALALLDIFYCKDVGNESFLAQYRKHILTSITYINTMEDKKFYTQLSKIFYSFISHFLYNIKNNYDIAKYIKTLQDLSPELTESILLKFLQKDWSNYYKKEYSWQIVKKFITSIPKRIKYKTFPIIKNMLHIAEEWQQEEDIFHWLETNKLLDETKPFKKDPTKMFYTKSGTKLNDIKQIIITKYMK